MKELRERVWNGKRESKTKCDWNDQSESSCARCNMNGEGVGSWRRRGDPLIMGREEPVINASHTIHPSSISFYHFPLIHLAHIMLEIPHIAFTTQLELLHSLKRSLRRASKFFLFSFLVTYIGCEPNDGSNRIVRKKNGTKAKNSKNKKKGNNLAREDLFELPTPSVSIHPNSVTINIDSFFSSRRDFHSQAFSFAIYHTLNLSLSTLWVFHPFPVSVSRQDPSSLSHLRIYACLVRRSRVLFLGRKENEKAACWAVKRGNVENKYFFAPFRPEGSRTSWTFLSR